VPGEFNYSRLNNLGVAAAAGTYIVLLNNDTEVTDGQWLTELLSHAARPEVGAVGARLWYPDGTLQHGGVLVGIGGVATHAHTGLRKGELGYFARAGLTQNFASVTAACMVMRREVYLRAGGFDEQHLPVTFNDVDFCLRVRRLGLRIVWTPHAELTHHESASRGYEDTRAKQQRVIGEVAFMRERWGAELEIDPAYNPNFTLESERQFKLAFPPRVQKPWREPAAVAPPAHDS
jgi:GT2 family glycosyltransferase